MTILRDQIRTLAGRTCGFHSSELTLTGRPMSAISSECNKLVSKGQLFRARISVREVRYFTSADARDAYAISHGPKDPVIRARRGLAWRTTSRGPWAPDAPVVIPDHVKVQHCPSHAPRFREHTWGFVHG